MQKSHLIPPQLPLVFIKAAGLSPPDDNANVRYYFDSHKFKSCRFLTSWGNLWVDEEGGGFHRIYLYRKDSDMAKRMLERGYEASEITELTELPIEEISRL